MIEYEYAYLGPALHVIVLIGLVAISIAAVGVFVYLAFLPGKTARARSHPQAEIITVMGWIGLPTGGVLWVLGLLWALYRKPGPGEAGDLSSELLHDLTRQIERLEKLAERGKEPAAEGSP